MEYLLTGGRELNLHKLCKRELGTRIINLPGLTEVQSSASGMMTELGLQVFLSSLTSLMNEQAANPSCEAWVFVLSRFIACNKTTFAIRAWHVYIHKHRRYRIHGYCIASLPLRLRHGTSF